MLPHRGLLRSPTEERRLAPLQVETLLYLASQAGRVIGKEELFAQVWNGAAVEEGAITRCISELRGLLDDNAREPRFIQTVPKRGYVLLPTVEALPAASPRAQPKGVDASPERGSDSARLRPVFKNQRAGKRWRVRSSIAIVALVLGIGILGRGNLWPREDRAEEERTQQSASLPATPAHPSIAVLSIVDLAQNPDRPWLATALAEMLTTELAYSDGARVVPAMTVAQVRSELTLDEPLSAPMARQLFAALGLTYGVSGSLLVVPGDEPHHARLDLRVTTRGTEEVVAAVVETGELSALGELTLLAGLRLRQQLGLGDGLATDRRLTSTSSPRDPMAAHLFYRGLAALRRLNALEARDLLIEAIAREEESPWAHYALAEAWEALGHDTEATAAASRALALARDLPPVSRLRIEAKVHATAGRWDKALSRLEEIRAHWPDSPESALDLARMQLRAGRPQEAETTLAGIRRQASRDDPDPRLDLTEATAFADLGQHQQALERATTALAKAQEHGADRMIAKAHLARAKALYKLGGTDRAEEEATEAARSFRTAGDHAGEILAHIELAGWLENRGEMSSAEDLERKALEGARKIGNVRAESELLRMSGKRVWNGGDPEAGQSMLLEAIELNREAGHRPGEAAALNTYAVQNAIHETGVPIDGLFRQVLAIYREMGDRDRISAALMNLGRLALLEGRVAEAVDSLEEAEAIQSDLGLKNDLAVTRFNLGYARSYTGDTAGALTCFEQAAQSFRSLEATPMLAASLVGVAQQHLEADHPAEAEASLREGLALAQNADPRIAAESYPLLARILLARGDLEHAEQAAREAQTLAADAEYSAAILSARRALADVLVERDLLDEARIEADRLESERPDDWTVRALSRWITIARVLASTGEDARAKELLRRTRELARDHGAEALELEASLALLEAELGTATETEETIVALWTLERRASFLGLKRLARRARDLGDPER